MLVLPARAKVNLALDVLGRREDGFHDIDTIIVPVDWHDIVGIAVTPSAITVTVTGDESAAVPANGDENIAARAATALREVAAMRGVSTGFRIWLDKRVPAAAGLGGGSADAAAVLRGGARLLERAGLTLAEEELAALGAALGSDVPAALAGRGVRVTGRGEHVQPLRVPILHLVVAFVGASSTAAAYARLLPEEHRAAGRIGRLATALAGAATEPPDGLLGSVLEDAALRADTSLAARLHALRSLDPARRWHMTGSGGAFFTVAVHAAAGRRIAAAVTEAGIRARVCRTLSSSAPR